MQKKKSVVLQIFADVIVIIFYKHSASFVFSQRFFGKTYIIIIIIVIIIIIIIIIMTFYSPYPHYMALRRT